MPVLHHCITTITNIMWGASSNNSPKRRVQTFVLLSGADFALSSTAVFLSYESLLKCFDTWP